MSREEILKIQTCALKVNIHCDGCQKKVKKILHKIEGVCQTRIDAEQGKVTVAGMLDPDTIIKKLNKAGKPAELWGSNSKGGMAMANQFQKLQLDGGSKSQSMEAGGGKGQKGGAAGGSKDMKMVMPQPTPQQLQQLQQMQMKGMKMPQLMEGKMPFAAAAPAKDPRSVKFSLPEDEFVDDGGELEEEFNGNDGQEGFQGDGLELEDDLYDGPKMMMNQMAMPPNAGGGDKKGGNGGNEIPVQIKLKANNGGGKNGGKLNLGGGGGNGGGKNGGGGQSNNANGGGVPVHGNQPGQGKKGGGGGEGSGSGSALGVGGQMMGGGMPPQQQQQTAMMRPANMMRGAGFAGMGGSMGHNPPMGGGQGAGAGGVVHGMPAGGGGMLAGGGGMLAGGGGGMLAGGGGGMLAGGGGGMSAAGFYQNGGGGGMSSGPVDYVALIQQQQMQQQQMIQQQIMQQQNNQQQMVMMNGNMNGNGYGYGQQHGGGPAGYSPMGYGYNRPQMTYPTTQPFPHTEPYNYFSDENPNGCSVM